MHVFICRYTCIYIICLYTQIFFNNCLFLSIHPHVLILLYLCKCTRFRTFSYLHSHNLVTLQDVFLHYLLATLGLVAALEKQVDTWCRLDFSWGLFSHLQGGFWPPLGCWWFSPDNPQQSILQMIMKRWRKGCRACGRKERSRCRKVEWWYLIAVQCPTIREQSRIRWSHWRGAGYKFSLSMSDFTCKPYIHHFMFTFIGVL